MEKLLENFMQKESDELIKEFQKHMVMPQNQARLTFKYLKDLAKGKIITNATMIRNFIKNNPLYKKDSILSEVGYLITAGTTGRAHHSSHQDPARRERTVPSSLQGVHRVDFSYFRGTTSSK